MGKSIAKQIRRSAEYLTNATFTYYYNKLIKYAITAFNWSGLPDNIDTRFVEQTLLYNGCICFFYDNELGQYLMLPFNDSGNYDYNNNPLKVNVYANNGYTRQLDSTDCVLIYDNVLRYSIVNDLVLFANRLTELERTIDVNVSAQKTPMLLLCDEVQRLTLINAFTQYQNGIPVIFGSKDFNKDMFDSISTKADYIADKLEDLKIKRLNEVLTDLGIPNVGTEKKERLIIDEIDNANADTDINKISRLKPRLAGAEQINKKFNLNVTVTDNITLDFNNVVDDTDNADDNGEGDKN